jgi:hypothetical protein
LIPQVASSQSIVANPAMRLWTVLPV